MEIDSECKEKAIAGTDEESRLDATSSYYGTDSGELNRRLVVFYTLRALTAHLGSDKSVVLMGLGDGYIAREMANLLSQTIGSRRIKKAGGIVFSSGKL